MRCCTALLLLLFLLVQLAFAEEITLIAPNGYPITIGSPLGDVRKALGVPRIAETVPSLRTAILAYADGTTIAGKEDRVTGITLGTQPTLRGDGAYAWDIAQPTLALRAEPQRKALPVSGILKAFTVTYEPNAQTGAEDNTAQLRGKITAIRAFYGRGTPFLDYAEAVALSEQRAGRVSPAVPLIMQLAGAAEKEGPSLSSLEREVRAAHAAPSPCDGQPQRGITGTILQVLSDGVLLKDVAHESEAGHRFASSPLLVFVSLSSTVGLYDGRPLRIKNACYTGTYPYTNTQGARITVQAYTVAAPGDYNPAPRAECCLRCGGKTHPCGDGCIPVGSYCTEPSGCACAP